MGLRQWYSGLAVVLVAAAGLVASGCGPADNSGGEAKDKVAHVHDKQGKEADEKGHDHGGWWCAEHGVPEATCGRCNDAYAAECQEKGDWCKEHGRPRSQCFICDPSL